MTAYIDPACWPRKEQFEFYRSLDRPQYSVCVQLDVTHFHARVKKRGISFSHTFGFFCDARGQRGSGTAYAYQGRSGCAVR